MQLHASVRVAGMSERPDAAAETAWVRLNRAQRMAMATVEDALKRAGLPQLVWYDVLLELWRCGERGLRPVELERAMLLAQYNLSRLVQRMEAAGYVERCACPEDARGHRLRITASGERVRQQMWPVYARAIQDAVGRKLSKAQADQLSELLSVLLEARQST